MSAISRKVINMETLHSEVELVKEINNSQEDIMEVEDDSESKAIDVISGDDMKLYENEESNDIQNMRYGEPEVRTAKLKTIKTRLSALKKRCSKLVRRRNKHCE